MTVDGFAPWPTDALDASFQAWIDGVVGFVTFAGLVAVAVLVVAGASTRSAARRGFWCRLAGRDVEVEFETRGLWRRVRSVRCCSGFESGLAACRRPCLEASYRRQWEPAIPLWTRGRP